MPALVSRGSPTSCVERCTGGAHGWFWSRGWASTASGGSQCCGNCGGTSGLCWQTTGEAGAATCRPARSASLKWPPTSSPGRWVTVAKMAREPPACAGGGGLRKPPGGGGDRGGQGAQELGVYQPGGG